MAAPSSTRVLWLFLFAVFALGCSRQLYAQQPCRRPDLSGCVIDELKPRGNAKVSSDDIKEKIATAETSRPLGGSLEDIPILSAWDRLTLEYERLDPYVLERDLARIERLYRSKGYYEAHVDAARTRKDPDGHIAVEIQVDEGVPVKMASTDVVFKDGTPPDTQSIRRDYNDALRDLKKGVPFDETAYEEAKKKLRRIYTNHGFAYATVEGKASVDLVKHEAKVVYTIELGPLCTFGTIKLSDLGELPEDRVRTRLDIKPGDKYSTEKIDDAQLDLARLGVFGAIEAKPQLTDKPGVPRVTEVPLVINAQEGQLRLIRFGFGGAVGSRVEVHAIAGWENRDFLGGLRYLSVDAKPGLVFFPLRIDNLFSQAPTNYLPEVRVRSRFVQPGFLESRTDFVFNVTGSVYLPETTSIETDLTTVIGYVEVADNIGLERYWLKQQIKTGIYYNTQIDVPFAYAGSVPEGYRRVLILYPEANVVFDFRRDKAGKFGAQAQVDPHSGIYTAIDTQVAFLGDVTDVRVRPDIRIYLPVTRKMTLAFRAVTGLLVPSNYGSSLKNTATPCSQLTGTLQSACEDNAARDQQLLQFRAFFSGGPSSNRGYPVNGVGPQDKVTFLNPNAAVGDVIATGGLALWESSLELRVPFGETVGGVLFVDGSDVTRTLGLRFTAPHLSAGVGFRYETPVGPFRADLGYRIPCLQVVGECGEVPANEGTAGDLFGVPLTFNLAIGEAF